MTNPINRASKNTLAALALIATGAFAVSIVQNANLERLRNDSTKTCGVPNAQISAHSAQHDISYDDAWNHAVEQCDRHLAQFGINR